MEKEYLPGSRNKTLSTPKAVIDQLGFDPAAVSLPAAFEVALGIRTGERPDYSQVVLPSGFNQILGIQQTQPVEEEPVDNTGFIPSVKRGAGNTVSSLANLFGADELALDASNYAAQFPKEIERIQDVKDLSDLGTFAMESAAENVGNLLLLAGGAIAGSFAPIAGGAALGAGGVNLLLQAGESKQAVEAEGVEPNLVNVGAPAIINTAMDTFSFLKIAQKAGVLQKVVKTMDEAAEVSGLAGRLKKGATTAGSSFLLEGSTETAQNYVNLVSARLANDKEFKEALALSGEDADDLINAFAAGGFGAAVTAGPLSAAFAKTKQETAEKTNVAPTLPRETVSAEPKDDVPIVEETPEETQAKGLEGEPTEVPDTPYKDVDDLVSQIEAKKQFILAGAPESYNPQLKKIGDGVSVRSQYQKASIDSYADNPLWQDWWDVPVRTLNGEETTIFNSVGVDAPTTVIQEGFAKGLKPEYLQEIANYTEVLRKQFMPDVPVMLLSNELMSADPKAAGQMAPFALEGRKTFGITLSPGKIQALIQENFGNMDDVKAKYMSTIAHEMGHAIVSYNFQKEDARVKNAVYSEYQNWLDSLKTATFKEFLETRYNEQSYKLMTNGISQEVLDMKFLDVAPRAWGRESLQYQLSFEEYAAENFAKIANKDARIKKDMSPESRKFWAKAYEAFKKVFQSLGKMLKAPPKYTAWINLKRDEVLRDALYKIPLESETIVKEASQYFDGNINKLKSTLNYPIKDGERFKKTVDTFSEDINAVRQLDAIIRVSTGFTRKKGVMFTPSQIAERYNIPQAKKYMEKVYEYYQTKMKGISEADAIAKRWMSLPQDKADNLGKFMYEVSEKSDRLSRRLSNPEMDALRSTYGIDAELFELYNSIDKSFVEILERLERSMVKDVARQYVTDAEAFTVAYLNARTTVDRVTVLTSFNIQDVTGMMRELKDIEKSFMILRNKNYFPRMRFGKYTLTVKKVVNGKIVVDEFLTFESKKEQESMLKEYQSEYSADIANKKVSVTASMLDDTTRSLYGMPQLVIDRIVNALDNPENGTPLTAEQRKALKDISLDLSPGRRYLRHMQKRKNTKGFSVDAMRTYASYMANASNHLARVEHTADMTQALRELKQIQREYQGDTTDLAELESYYTDHFKYLLNPENDYAKLRAFGFMWYLGFNVKSALVNTTQLPMVTYPYLGSRYGDVAAWAQLFKGMKDVAAHYLVKKRYSVEEQRLLDKLIEDGVIDESMASDLAGISEGTALQRLMPTNKAHKVVNNLNYYGGYLFSVAEKFNRQVTALAAFRLHMKQSGSFEDSYKAAKDAIHKSQFEYAKYNRPEFMRGKKSVFLLFYNYTQQFMYLIMNGSKTNEGRQTAIRMWGMLLLMGGLQGLPFAEYILSTLDFLGTNAKKFFGMENPKVNIRQDIRELLGTITDNPDYFMHGAGYFMGAGPLKLLEMFGVPVPNLDISGSLGMGEALPGFRMNELNGNPDEIAGKLLLNGLGPVPNIFLGVWDSIASNDPDSWKRLEKALPVFAKSISKATRYATRGAETTRGGAEFLPYDDTDPYQAAEIIAQGLGFTATRLSQKRKIYGEQMATSLYWKTRRDLMMERYAYAVKTGDAKFKREVMEDIKNYNAQLTDAALKPYRISGVNLRNSLRSKMRILSLRERGLPTTKRDRLIYKEIADSYE